MNDNWTRPAFPMQGFVGVNGDVHTYPEFGLTKREAFAKAAMQGLCASHGADWWEGLEVEIAKQAAKQANATLAALDGVSPPASSEADSADAEKLRSALAALVDHVERNECEHEDARRGGNIWTICGACGCMWADDEGGFPGYEEPPALTAAIAALRGKDAP